MNDSPNTLKKWVQKRSLSAICPLLSNMNAAKHKLGSRWRGEGDWSRLSYSCGICQKVKTKPKIQFIFYGGETRGLGSSLSRK